MNFKHSIANIITGIRIVSSVIMLFCQVFSPAFYSFYIVTGAMLFAFPLTLTSIDLKYSSAVVCLVATVAAIQEGYLINRNVMNSSKPLPG